jgi:hypothetical protein
MPKPILRLNLILLSAIAIMAIPTIVITLLGWNSASSLAMLAAMGGLFSAAGLGWRGLIPLAIATGVGTFLATFVNNDPLASAVLMLAVGAALGSVNKWGLSVWNFMFPVLVTAVIAQPPLVSTDQMTNAFATGAIGLGCVLLGGALTTLIVKKPVQKEITKYTLKVNVVYAVNLALLLSAAGYFAALKHQELLGMWAALSVVIILIEPYSGQNTTKALQRAAGTVLGFLLAIGVSASELPHILYLVAGLLFIEIALLVSFVGKREYWEYVMFLTPGVVLLSGPAKDVGQVSDFRLEATILAVLACLVVLGIEQLLFWRGGLKKPQTTAVTTNS